MPRKTIQNDITSPELLAQVNPKNTELKKDFLQYLHAMQRSDKPYLDLWIQEREKQGIKSEWLFPDKQEPSKHMDADILNSWCKTWSRLLGVDVYPHAFRHRACTALAKAGLPDDVIQHIFGWNSLELVGIYKDIDPVDDLGKYFSNGEIMAPKQASLSDL